MKILRAALRLGLFALWCLLLVPVQMIVMAFTRGSGAYAVPHLWQKGVCRIFGISVLVRGAPHTAGQVLFVGNHLSYLDIPAIASILKASFVAKHDVAAWPVFGFLSRLQQTAFISRIRNHAGREKNALDTIIAEGKSLIIFPEGTSTDGRKVLPFKSSLFALILHEKSRHLVVQPFTIRLLAVDGRPPQGREDRLLYAWPRDDDTELPAHLWRFAGTRGAAIELSFHQPLQAAAYQDRKTLAQDCRQAVAGALEKPDGAVRAA